jgi:phage terminase Nu1 subunit (DNA packaging protein)
MTENQLKYELEAAKKEYEQLKQDIRTASIIVIDVCYQELQELAAVIRAYQRLLKIYFNYEDNWNDF